MNRADSPKPPVAPKPKTTRTLPPVTTPKLPSSPRPDGLHSPNFMSRGPKPPIAPKPKLAAPNEWRASVSVNNSLNKCSNGRLLCVDRGLYEGFRPSLECSESETDEDYIVAPRAPPKEDKPEDGSCGEDVVTVALSAAGEEEGTEACGGEGLPAADGSAGGALSGEDEEGADDEEGIDHTPKDEDSPLDLGTREEDEELADEQNLGSPEDNVLWDREDVSGGDIILTPVDPDKEPRPPEALGEVEGDDRTGCANMEPGGPGEDNAWDAEDATKAPPENEDLATGIQEAEVTRENSGVSEQECDTTEDPADEAAGPDPDEQTEHEEMLATPTEAQEDLQEGEDGELAEDEASEESCHIVPFENECVDDFPPSRAQSPYEFFPTESTSFCGESSSPLPEPAESSNPECEQRSGPCMEEDLVAGEGLCVPDVVVVPEEEGEDTTDDALANPYVIGVIPTCQADPGEGGQVEISADGDTLASCGLREELDADGGSLSMDRKNVVARARPHSGKVAGSVPETVPEETGPEAGTLATSIEECPEQVGKTVLSSLSSEGKPMEVGRALPAKPRAFTLYPRSFSVEGREVPACMSREPDGLDDLRIKRKDDNLSLPCVIGSSGSFSQRNHLPSSGTSTPSSMVDIPPPFDLACITKKPITKSSPSLLTESDSPDKHPKKKKSSFKRFLELTFRKKTENKVHVDVNVSSSRSSSESSYHGPARILELDRRSLSNSPQLKARPGKLRASDSPSSLIFYRDSKRRGVPFSRTVSRVESFEDRSRPPFLPLPLTKPRSISFPNADTSDYENIPAMNSDYENIQIPPRRPARAGTFTKLFEDQSRALSTANENDGYVDMSSFNAFESKQQNAEQDAESAYTEPYKVCPISVVAPREDLTSEEEQKSSEEEEEGAPSLTHKVEGHSRALAIAQELLSSEKAYVEMLQHLHLDFHGAVLRVLDDLDQESRDPLAHEELRQGLGELPAILDLHQGILEELQVRLSDWEVQQKVADVFLTREQDFDHHAAHILQFDRYLGLLTESCQRAPQLAVAVREFEQSQQGGSQSVKHRLLRVVQRLFQYQVLLTDYLNNLCPDSAEYDATQGALTLISKVTDRANDSMEQGENLQKLVHIEHSVRGQGDLLQPGREFLKEGTLLKVTGKNRHPRHLFLMSDMLLYTYPLKDGKYRLRSSLPVSGMKVSRPVTEKVPYALKIETPECCLLLSASSCAERDEWYGCLSRALPEDYKAQALAAFHHSVEIRERLGVSLGERPPTLVPVTHVMMCMNCGCDFSLTLRRHHCHACGKIVCRNCSRNKYPLKYLKDRMAKVCDGCFGELKKRGGPVPSLMRERPVSMSFPLSSARFSGSAFSSVFHGINPSAFKKQKKVPSALTEVAASGEGSAISGYLSRCKKGKRHWKKLWFVIKGKVLYTYVASEDKVAMESMPLLGFTIAPEREEGSSQGGPVFHLYHKKTLFYSFKAEDASSAQRWIEAMEDASVL